MNTRTRLVVAALAFLLPVASVRGDGDERGKKGPSAAEVAALYLSDAPADVSKADSILDAAAPAFVRAVLAEVRNAADPYDREIDADGVEPTRPPPSDLLVALTAQWLDVSRDVAGRYVPLGESAEQEGTKSRLRVLAPPEAASIYARKLDAATVLQVFVTTVLLNDGHSTRLPFLAGTTSYVWGYRLESHEAAPLSPQPIVGHIEERLDVLASPRITRDRKHIELSLGARAQELVRPIAVEMVDLVAGDPVSVQRPELVDSRWSRVVTIGDGETVLVAQPQGGSSARVLVLLLTAKVVPAGTSAPPTAPVAVPDGHMACGSKKCK